MPVFDVDFEPQGTPAMRTLSLLAAATVGALLSPTVSAQETIAPGFAVASSGPAPVAFASSDSTSDGRRVFFDGSTVDLYDASGAFLSNLGTTASFVFASFVEVDPTDTFAIVGESSNGDIYKVMLDGSGMTPIATIQFSYDAVFEDGSNLLVSATHFGSGNDILRLDTDTGTYAPVAVVPGYGGPLDLAPNGDLVYGEPSMTGGRVLRFDAALLSAGPVLDEFDADVLVSGLDGASSLVVDPVFGNIFMTSNVWAVSGYIFEFDGDGNLVDTIASSAAWLTGLEFVQGPGVGHFHAYQPADGLNLRYSNGTDEVVIAPQRPVLTHTQFGHFATIHVTGAVPNAGALVTFGPAPNVVPEYSVQLSFDFLFHTDMPMNNIRRLGLRIPTDANGEGSFSYFTPGGGTPGTRWFQLLVTDANNLFVGSSNSVTN